MLHAYYVERSSQRYWIHARDHDRNEWLCRIVERFTVQLEQQFDDRFALRLAERTIKIVLYGIFNAKTNQ